MIISTLTEVFGGLSTLGIAGSVGLAFKVYHQLQVLERRMEVNNAKLEAKLIEIDKKVDKTDYKRDKEHGNTIRKLEVERLELQIKQAKKDFGMVMGRDE